MSLRGCIAQSRKVLFYELGSASQEEILNKLSVSSLCEFLVCVYENILSCFSVFTFLSYECKTLTLTLTLDEIINQFGITMHKMGFLHLPF